MEIKLKTPKGEIMLRSGDTCWEFCELVNIKREDKVVQEWRPFKYYANLAQAFLSLANIMLRESDASTLKELHKTMLEVQDEIVRLYRNAFVIDTSVGDAKRTGTEATGEVVGGEPVMEKTCSCGGDCGKQLVLDGMGVERGDRCVPSVGKGMGDGKPRHSRSGKPVFSNTGATPEGAEDAPKSHSRVQRKSKKSQDCEVR